MSTKILLADDSITIQKVIGIIFGGEDYSLTIVDNGKAAFDKALEVSPDILLIDALMPGMSGYEVCERIRATPELASKPILLLTGSFEPFDETKAKNCGANDFIAKPFESQQIIAKVTELCEQSALSAFNTPQVKITEPDLPEAAQPAPPAEPTLASVIPANNIWDAFTPTDPEPEADIPPLAGLEQTSFPSQTPEQIASPWIPIDETSFQFEEESSADTTIASLQESSQVEEIAFGDSPFAVPTEPALSPPELSPVSAEVPEAAEVPEPVEILKPVETLTAVPSAALTEEQLRAAITTASKEVIERIVWEVVPDLAETMIKEAIRRITEDRP
jgi:CheY-like chemotaxis protein